MIILLTGIRASLLAAADGSPLLQRGPADAPSPSQPLTNETEAPQTETIIVSKGGRLEADDMNRTTPLVLPKQSSDQPTAPGSESAPAADCFQILGNSQLDVVDLGDGTGSAEPWVVLDQIVYYDPAAADKYLYFVDADVEDATPTLDSFGQGFLMPPQLESIQIVYDAGTVDSTDPADPNTPEPDEAYGELWLIDQDGFLQEAVLFWRNPDPVPTAQFPDDDNWREYTVDVTEPEFITQLSGKTVAIRLLNITDGVEPGESVFFDNITLTACVQSAPVSGKLYLPNVLHVANTTPVCVPPSEVPQDEVDANRGLVQTSATCLTTLSQLDTQDYYTFLPQQGGNHTLKLSKLPPGSEWSGSVIVKSGGSYVYAPGPTGGQCRIATPGSGNKQVTCSLQAGTEYVVKVSAGQYTGAEASYEMQVVR
jgi:hypothetical protein